jgi:hypothetical protein
MLRQKRCVLLLRVLLLQLRCWLTRLSRPQQLLSARAQLPRRLRLLQLLHR